MLSQSPHQKISLWAFMIAINRRFSKLTKFSANCHLVNDWSCFVIGGSRGLCRHAPPQQHPILSFLHMFLPKSTHIGGWHPPNNSVPPQWEILDPPLFVEHKLQHLKDSTALLVLWYSSGLISQRLGVQIPAEVGFFFFIFKNYLCKLPIGNKFQLGKLYNVSVAKCQLPILQFS